MKKVLITGQVQIEAFSPDQNMRCSHAVFEPNSRLKRSILTLQEIAQKNREDVRFVSADPEMAIGRALYGNQIPPVLTTPYSLLPAPHSLLPSPCSPLPAKPQTRARVAVFPREIAPRACVVRPMCVRRTAPRMCAYARGPSRAPRNLRPFT